jgi:hypothetical protein
MKTTWDSQHHLWILSTFVTSTFLSNVLARYHRNEAVAGYGNSKEEYGLLIRRFCGSVPTSSCAAHLIGSTTLL